MLSFGDIQVIFHQKVSILKPYILVTNDDGIHAPGILALTNAMVEIGEVIVTAPATNQSASGHKKTLYTDIPVHETTLANGVKGWAVNGSPADCIALAAMGLLPWPPALVVSGINRGENMSQDITYSGTVTAALEAAIQGIPAIAMSSANRLADAPEDYAEAARIAIIMAQHVLARGLPPLTILNVNVPVNPPKGIRLTRQGVRIYRDALVRLHDGVVQIGGEPPIGELEDAATDIWAVANDYVSLTPIHLDMTAHRFMADLAAWEVSIDADDNQ
jgi:5'-nucleotidase